MDPDEEEAGHPLLGEGTTKVIYGMTSTELLDSNSSLLADIPDGIMSMEAVTMTWTKWGLVVAYMRCV